MPSFDRQRPPRRPREDETPNVPVPYVSTEISEPRCHVCTSPHRRAIDKLLAMGTNFSEIGRMFDIDRRSISNHRKEHLNYEEAAIRQIIDEEIQAAQENVEEGIKGVVARRVYLQTAARKALEDLLNGDQKIEPKDALAIIQYLDKMEGQAHGAEIEQIKLQFNAFMQAIREVCTPDVMQLILDRTREIIDSGGRQLGSGE